MCVCWVVGEGGGGVDGAGILLGSWKSELPFPV